MFNWIRAENDFRIDEIRANGVCGERIPEISNFIEYEVDRLSKKKFNFPKTEYDTEKLNLLFRSALEEVW
jgi:hypothetical protein